MMSKREKVTHILNNPVQNATILKLDRDWKFLNADFTFTWTQQFDWKFIQSM